MQVFISYARADGLAAATRLRAELNALGVDVWRDLEEMRGGLAWKKQLLAALGAVDAVLLLLTPSAVASPTVQWEWETALLQDKRVIPLLIAACDVPVELQPFHYHRLDDPALYPLGLAHLGRDLMTLAVERGPGASAPADKAAGGITLGKIEAVNVGETQHIDQRGATFNVGAATKIDTGGAAYVGGNVTTGGDFIGRDQLIKGTGLGGEPDCPSV